MEPKGGGNDKTIPYHNQVEHLVTTLMKAEGEELTTSTDDLSLSLPRSFDKKVWLSFRSNCRARLLNAILEELLEVSAGGLEGQTSILEESWRCLFQVLLQGFHCHISSRCQGVTLSPDRTDVQPARAFE